MSNYRLGLLFAVSMPLLSLAACNHQPQYTGDPSDPMPIIGCGVQNCATPTPTPTVCPLVAGSECGGPPRAPFPIDPLPTPTPTFLPIPGPTATPIGPEPGPIDSSGSFGSSVGQGTKDTSLQAASYQQNLMNAQAQNLVNRFAMSVTAARQLAQLANRIQAMSAAGNGQLTDTDRAAVTQSALGIAGLTTDQVSQAVSQSQQGNSAAMESVLETAAKNLGMTSSATLRDELLPALGMTLN